MVAIEFLDNISYQVYYGDMKTAKYLKNIGALIQETRQARNMTQNELAEELGTSQSAINRIENGKQNISLEMIARIGEVLSSEIVQVGRPLRQKCEALRAGGRGKLRIIQVPNT